MSVFDRLHGVEYWIKKGKEAVNSYDFVAAQYFFEQALKKDPDNLSALFKCASCLIEDDLPAESLPMLSKCIKLDPNNMLYREKKGEVLEILKWWEPAKCWYERQISENPENIRVWWGHKALCLNKAGKSDEAVEWLNQCLRNEPKFDIGLYLLGAHSTSKCNLDHRLKRQAAVASVLLTTAKLKEHYETLRAAYPGAKISDSRL